MNKRSKLSIIVIVLLGLLVAGSVFFVVKHSSLHNSPRETTNNSDQSAAQGVPPGADQSADQSAAQSTAGGGLTIYNLDVGKADCAVIISEGSTGIIDAATPEACDTIDHFLVNKNISSFDYMILTHYDRDHIGSAVDILEKYDVRSIYIPDYVSAKEYYAPLMKVLDGRDGVTTVSGVPLDVALPDLSLRILPATDPEALKADEKDYDNNMSLVCLMTYGDSRFLFTGDIEHDRIAQILDDGEDISADWIKIPHHGSYEKKIKKLLKTTGAQYAVISTSTDNPPDEKLMSAIDKKGIDVFSTADGDVVTTSDGKTVVVSGVSGGRTF